MPQRREQGCQIRGQSTLEFKHFAGHGMFETEDRGVQGLAAERLQQGTGFRREQVGLAAKPLGIKWIAEHGVAHMGHMDANLVGAAGFELAGDQAHHRRFGVWPKTFVESPMRDGLASAVRCHHGHALAVGGVATERRVDGTEQSFWLPPNEGAIATRERQGPAMVGEERGKAAMRRVGLGHDEQARRILVEPVDDARPFDPADPR